MQNNTANAWIMANQAEAIQVVTDKGGCICPLGNNINDSFFAADGSIKLAQNIFFLQLSGWDTIAMVKIIIFDEITHVQI